MIMNLKRERKRLTAEEKRQKRNKFSREYMKKRWDNDPEFRKRIMDLKHERMLKKAVDEMLEKGKDIEN